MEILADTNILLYLLDGDETIASMLDGKFVCVSFITQLELLGFKDLNTKEETRINQLLLDCRIIPLNDSILQEYIKLRRKYALKLPDAVIAATAMANRIPLISADKQFSSIKEIKLVSYEF